MRGSSCRRFATAALLALAAFAPAAADELVKFRAAPRLDQAAPAQAGIRGYLAKPAGKGPFPAVVLLHNCLGLPANRSAIESEIAAWGYVALFVDDFAPRRLKETCTVDFPEGVADAYGALAFLSKLPYVDASRIAAVGYSQGADTALTIASGRLASAFAAPDGARFRATAAFYPPCANQSGARMEMPTLIVVGGADEVTPAADCERLAGGQSDHVRLVVYPGAAHGFDAPEFGNGRRVLGMLLKYDRGAAGRSKAELSDFLGLELRR